MHEVQRVSKRILSVIFYVTYSMVQDLSTVLAIYSPSQFHVL